MALCLTGCVRAEPVLWPADFLTLGSRFLVVTDTSGERSLFVVDPAVSTVLPTAELDGLFLLGYPETPEALGLSVVDGRVRVAPAGTSSADSKPLPPGARGFHWAPAGWQSFDELGPFEPIRVMAAPCPTYAEQHSFDLGTDADVDVLIPYGPERVLTITRGNGGRGSGAEATAHLVTLSGIAPAPEILAAISAKTSSIARIASYAVGDDVWLVFQAGDVLRLSRAGTVEKIASPVLGAHLELVGAAGGVDPDGSADVFAFSSRWRAENTDPYEPAELYHLAPGSARWEATGFPDGERDSSCPHEGGVGSVDISYLGRGKVRFTYERAGIYTYDALTRTYAFETISAPAEQYCRTAVDWSDPRHPVAVVERTVAFDARSDLYQRDEGTWRRLGDLPPAIAADITIRFGGERYFPLHRGQIQLFRTYQDLRRRDFVFACPPVLSAGGNIDRAAVTGRLMVVDGGRRGDASYVEVAILPEAQ